MRSTHANKTNMAIVVAILAICFFFFTTTTTLASPAINDTEYLNQFKYEDGNSIDSGNVTAFTVRPYITAAEGKKQTEASDLYTVQLTHHGHRQVKHNDAEVAYDYKCPKQHHIHPCDCLELDKRAEMLEGSGGETDTNATPTMEMIEEEPIHPDHIETVAFCKNIRNVQVLVDAIRGFQVSSRASISSGWRFLTLHYNFMTTTFTVVLEATVL